MKRFISLLLALILCLSLSATAFADVFAPEDEAELAAASVRHGDSTQAEETCWYFRTVNGIRQMRQWSLTYGRWLTDWIDIGPAL